jgi:hypothetical protein
MITTPTHNHTTAGVHNTRTDADAPPGATCISDKYRSPDGVL